VRVVFDLSASANLVMPLTVILVSVLSENERSDSLLPLRPREVRDEFDSSASAISIAPSSPMLFPVMSEDVMKQQVNYQ
jgi:hypothetical protein